MEDNTWEMTLTYDPTTDEYHYNDCVQTNWIHPDESDPNKKTIYENGTGKIYLKGKYLYWVDDVEGIRDNCPFEQDETYHGTAASTNTSANTPIDLSSVSYDSLVQLEEYLAAPARCYMNEYHEDYFTTKPEEMIDFALCCINLYSYDSVVYDSSTDTEFYPTEIVDEALNFIFGRTVSHPVQKGQPYQDWDYVNGMYSRLCADGEFYEYVPCITTLSITPNNTLFVEFTLYSVDMDAYWDKEAVYSDYLGLSPQEASNHPDLEYSCTGSAKLVEYTGEDGYVYYYIKNYIENH